MVALKSFMAVALIAVLLPAAAGAAERAGRFFISPAAGGYLFEGGQGLKLSATYGLSFGYNLTESVGTEIGFNFIDSAVRRNALQMDAYMYRLDAVYFFRPAWKLYPYLAAGGGAVTFDPDPGKSRTRAMVQYGGGVEYFLNDSVALRADARHVITFNDVFHNLMFTGGLKVYLGGRKNSRRQAYKRTETP